MIKKRLCQIGFTSKKASNHFAKFKQVKRLAVITLAKSQNLLVAVTYLDFFWAGRLPLGVSPSPFPPPWLAEIFKPYASRCSKNALPGRACS